jgi:hypothetical protein
MPGRKKSTLASAVVVVVVTAMTLASRAGLVSADALSASPQRIAHGKVWLLLSNALLVQRPLALCLFSFVLLIFLTPVVCGTRVFVASAVVGHIGSTLLTYALAGGVYAVDPGAVRDLVSYPDYGVSAIQAAWIGAIAATLWQRSGQTQRGRALVVAACLAVAGIAYAVRSDLTLLDTDHFFAFVIGATLAAGVSRRASTSAAQLARRLFPPRDATPAAAIHLK